MTVADTDSVYFSVVNAGIDHMWHHQYEPIEEFHQMQNSFLYTEKKTR